MTLQSPLRRLLPRLLPRLQVPACRGAMSITHHDRHGVISQKEAHFKKVSVLALRLFCSVASSLFGLYPLETSHSRRLWLQFRPKS